MSEGFILRVLGPDGAPVGVATLVGTREVVTCAHVVNTALGADARAQPQPDRAVSVDFPLLEGPALTARVVRWLPPPREGAAGDDIAGLVLDQDPPPGAAAARLALNPPVPGLRVRVFGCPPGRPAGGWVPTAVQGQVGGGLLQLDSGVDAALRVRQGYSGSPVYDDKDGRVIGMVALAPLRSGERDSYAIGTERLRLAWPEVLGAGAKGRRAAGAGPGGGAERLTILHVSDPQFGAHHLFGGNGLTPADQAYDTLFARLHEDLTGLAADHDLRPDLLVATGDLAEWGRPAELRQATEFLGALADAVELPRHRVALVPGNHDVNRKASQAYFLGEESEDREPVPPYFPKWKSFVEAFTEFYAAVPGITFTPDEPWTLFEMPDLAVVVAGLNSTMAESHRDEDHYGWVGEKQLRWFAERLADYRRRGWLRLVAVHHNVVRGAQQDDENLRDADDLDRILGEPGLVNLVLHGHTHDGRLQRLPSGLVALSTGSAAVDAGARPTEVPNQYQLVVVDPDGFTRHARQYAPGQKRWIGDTRISRTGSDWRDRQRHRLTDAGAALATEQSLADEGRKSAQPERRAADPDDFLTRVGEATRASFPHATVTLRPEGGYLRVSNPLPDSQGVEQWPVGVVDGPATGEALDAFVTQIHARFAAADPTVRSEFVHAGPPAPEDLVVSARRHGVRLRSFVDYQGLIDLRPLVDRQFQRLAADRVYPADLYVPQRYRLLQRTGSGEVEDDLQGKVIDWLGAGNARLVMVLGDFGRGKTALLRQLARTLPEALPGLLPVLVELRSLEKAPSLDELLGQHLIRQQVEDVNPAKLRYMIRSGRLALLFDGFDELELRVGYDNAADYLQALLESVTDRAKVVLTSRTQHFRSTAQVWTALGDRVAALTGSRMVVLEDFTNDQIMRFLTGLYDGDAAAAQARFDLLGEIEDLLGLARNPRMLAFIAKLDEERLRDIQQRKGRISAAELYRELVDFWLIGERDRQKHRYGLPTLDPEERLAACTALAKRLWASTQPTIPMRDLSAELSSVLTRLSERGYDIDQATHTVGSGSLLVRTDDGSFTFVHQSIMEWLVANAAAQDILHNGRCDELGARQMSQLMLDFFCDLAGADQAWAWAMAVTVDPDASAVAKRNGIAVRRVVERIGALDVPRAAVNLAGVDLRTQDLTGYDLRGANLTGADLSGMRLTDIDLSGARLDDADFTGVRMVGGSLRDAILDGSRWDRAALLGVEGADRSAVALRAAAVPGRDPAGWQLAPGGPVECVAFAPDGGLLAVGRFGAVELVDRWTDRTVRVLTGHTAAVTGVAFSPDSTLLATASQDRTVRLWEARTGELRYTLTDHPLGLNAVAFSPDGTVFATACNDTHARVWDTASGALRAMMKGHTDWVRAVAFSPDGRSLATASDDGTAKLWDPDTGQYHGTLTGHKSWVRAVAFSPDGTLLATASNDGTARLWDVATRKARTTLEGHTGWVPALAFSPDGARLATGSHDRTALLWDTATGRRTLLDLPVGMVTGVAFAPDGAALALGSDDGTVQLADIATGQARTVAHNHRDAASGLAFSPDGTVLATVSEARDIRLWNVATGAPRTRLKTEIFGNAAAVAFSPDGALVAAGCVDGTARLWNAMTGRLRDTLGGHTDRVTAVAFSVDGRLVATGSDDHTAQLWSTTTGHARDRLEGHVGAVTGVAFSPDGSLLATASSDGTARLWDASNGRPVAVLPGHTREVTAVAFSPDGKLLATTGRDSTAQLWQISTQRWHARLEGHTDWVTAVAFSPNGTLVATASDDTTARLWHTRSGRPAATLAGHGHQVRGVAFSPDGTLLATAADDSTTRLWDVGTGECTAVLLNLPEGYAVLYSDGTYKLDGDPGDVLWWAVKLCRFDPGELDDHVPGLERRPDDYPLR